MNQLQKIINKKFSRQRLERRLDMPWTHVVEPIQTFIERGNKGWSIRDTFDFDGYIARVLAEGIKQIRSVKHGYPDAEGMTFERWMEILDEIVEGFEAYLLDNEDPAGFTTERYNETMKKLDRSLKLFRKWFPAIWD